jgi:predicted amidophosphoribosyltransferase
MTAPLRRCSTCRAPLTPEAQACGLCLWDALPEADDPTAPRFRPQRAGRRAAAKRVTR